MASESSVIDTQARTSEKDPQIENTTVDQKPQSESVEAAVDAKDIEAAVPEGENSTGDSNDTQQLQGFRLYAIAIGVCFGALMMSLDISIIATVLLSTSCSRSR